MPAELNDVLNAYVAAFNEDDAAARYEQLERAVTNDVAVFPGYAPQAPVWHGRDAFAGEIADVVRSRPDPAIQLVLNGGVDEHHGWVRFRWRVLTGEGEDFSPAGVPIRGVDVAHLSRDGRFDTVVIFLGDDPPA